MTTPSVGRIIHYVARGSADGRFPKVCRAAIVSEVPVEGPNTETLIGLVALNPTGMFFHSLEAGGCTYDGSDDPAGGTWHWPERV